MASSTPRNSARDERGEHEGEADVGDDHVAPPGARLAVDVALAAQRPGGRLEGDDERGGDDRRLHEEDRPPVEQLGEHAAERRTDRRADGAGQRPPPPGPLAGIGAGTMAPSTGSEPASSSVAPTPWTARATSSSVRLLAKPATSDETAKIADAGDDERQRADPAVEAGRPGPPTTATTRAYVVSTHDTPTIDVSNSP